MRQAFGMGISEIQEVGDGRVGPYGDRPLSQGYPMRYAAKRPISAQVVPRGNNPEDRRAAWLLPTEKHS